MLSPADALAGCVLGTAAGDAIALPFEGLSRRAVGRLLRLPLEHSLVAGRGLVSDDTEHTVLAVLSLIDARADVRTFERRLAARLRWWMLALPPGVGSATARAIGKLWLGFAPARSGVRSAGNGPAMRAAVLGVAFADRPATLRAFVHASTRMTHTDPRAFEGALAVAVAAACASHAGGAPSLAAFEQAYREAAGDARAFAGELAALAQAAQDDADVAELARRLGCADGVTGFAPHTVPVALHAWLRHAGDFRAAVTAVVRCGGDTDTVAAITGAIVGAGLGPQAIPPSWLDGIVEWPRGVAWMRARCDELASPAPRARSLASERAWWPWTLARNLAVLVVLLLVLARRTLAAAIRR